MPTQLLVETSMLERYRQAFLLSAKHLALHVKYSRNFPLALREEWEEWVEAWEVDRSSRPNPYSENIISESRLHLFTARL